MVGYGSDASGYGGATGSVACGTGATLGHCIGVAMSIWGADDGTAGAAAGASPKMSSNSDDDWDGSDTPPPDAAPDGTPLLNDVDRGPATGAVVDTAGAVEAADDPPNTSKRSPAEPPLPLRVGAAAGARDRPGAGAGAAACVAPLEAAAAAVVADAPAGASNRSNRLLSTAATGAAAVAALAGREVENRSPNRSGDFGVVPAALNVVDDDDDDDDEDVDDDGAAGAVTVGAVDVPSRSAVPVESIEPDLPRRALKGRQQSHACRATNDGKDEQAGAEVPKHREHSNDGGTSAIVYMTLEAQVAWRGLRQWHVHSWTSPALPPTYVLGDEYSGGGFSFGYATLPVSLSSLDCRVTEMTPLW